MVRHSLLLSNTKTANHQSSIKKNSAPKILRQQSNGIYRGKGLAICCL